MIIGKINNKIPIDDLVLREQQENDSIYAIKFYAMQHEIDRLNNIINEAIKYNKEIRDLYSIYETSQERSNAETNLCILEDKETLQIFKDYKK